jgi:hypothetical protein
MITLVFAMLLALGVTALSMTYGMFGGMILLVLVVALVTFGIHRISRFTITD